MECSAEQEGDGSGAVDALGSPSARFHFRCVNVSCELRVQVDVSLSVLLCGGVCECMPPWEIEVTRLI